MCSNGENSKLNILCIHGYRQNAQTFKEKLGAFRKLIRNKAELSFVDAPLRVPLAVDGENKSDGSEYGWWFSSANDAFDALENSDICKGFEESLDVINKFVEAKGPFDGILGFSQGAAFVALLCILAERNGLPFKFKFAVLIAGFKSRCGSHVKMYDIKISIPTLHVFGDTDKVIPKELSKELAEQFENPTILNHTGGHFLPVTGQQKQIYLSFFREKLFIK